MLKTAVPAVSTKPLEGGFEEFLSKIFFANLTFGLFLKPKLSELLPILSMESALFDLDPWEI